MGRADDRHQSERAAARARVKCVRLRGAASTSAITNAKSHAPTCGAASVPTTSRALAMSMGWHHKRTTIGPTWSHGPPSRRAQSNARSARTAARRDTTPRRGLASAPPRGCPGPHRARRAVRCRRGRTKGARVRPRTRRSKHTRATRARAVSNRVVRGEQAVHGQQQDDEARRDAARGGDGARRECCWLRRAAASAPMAHSRIEGHTGRTRSTTAPRDSGSTRARWSWGARPR